MSAGQPIVITTRLPPQICGVGTYSWLVHKYRPNDLGSQHFVVMDGASESRAALGYEAITDFHGNPKILAQTLDRLGAGSILLHYAGHAYQRYGCPIWMPQVLRNRKARFPNHRLTVFFHEVPGELSRLSRHFITGKIGGRIVRQLAQIGDVLATNTTGHARIIRGLSGRDRVHCLPVGSNIEGAAVSAQPRAETEFVIFGLPFNRLQVLKSFSSQIAIWQKTGLLTKLHLVGPEEERFSVEIDSLVKTYSPIVVQHGMLAETGVSQLLSRVRFALTNVTGCNWSKSSVFMACGAHGCAVITKEKENEIPICHTVAENELAVISTDEIENRSACLKKWFEENASWPVITKRLTSFCQSDGLREQ